MRLLLHRATLPIELTNSNDGRGFSWHRTAAKRKRFVEDLAFIHRREPFAVPTSVVVTRVLGPRQRKWDYSSGFRGNWKEIEDTLVELGWWHDDGPEWIAGIEFKQDDTQRESGPCVVVEVYES